MVVKSFLFLVFLVLVSCTQLKKQEIIDYHFLNGEKYQISTLQNKNYKNAILVLYNNKEIKLEDFQKNLKENTIKHFNIYREKEIIERYTKNTKITCVIIATS